MKGVYHIIGRLEKHSFYSVINKIFEYDTLKHSGLFKYCQFSKNEHFKKNAWCVRRDLRNA